MNSITISGNLGRDAEMRNFESNYLIKFSLAHNYKQGEEEKTLWINCELWRQGEPAALAAALYLRKGRKIGVVGQLLDDSYQREEKRIKSFKIKVDRYYLLDSPDKPEKKGETTPEQAPAAPAAPTPQNGEVDLPF